MDNISALFTPGLIREIFYAFIEECLTPDVRANAEDLARMSYMAQGAKLLTDRLIEEIEGKE